MPWEKLTDLNKHQIKSINLEPVYLSHRTLDAREISWNLINTE